MWKKQQTFLFIASQTADVPSTKQNFRYLLWLVTKKFLSKGWTAFENVHFLERPFMLVTTVFPRSSRAKQVETILNVHFQKICTKKVIHFFHVVSKQYIIRACSERTCCPRFLEGFKMQLPISTVTNLCYMDSWGY